MTKIQIISLLLTTCALPAATQESTYYFTQLSQLEIVEGELPSLKQPHKQVRSFNNQKQRNLGNNLFPYIIGNNHEIYYLTMEGNSRLLTRGTLAQSLLNLRIATKTDPGKTPSGILYLPREDWSGMETVKFRIPAAPINQVKAKADYLKSKIAHFIRLRNLNVTGTAWYRHQIQEAEALLKKIPEDNRGSTTLNRNLSSRNNRNNLESTYSLFSGGRAVSENLQIDRQLRISNKKEEEPEDTDIQGIQGITIAEIDWNSRIDPNKAFQPDNLAKAIPHDQHALFFSSFQALLDLIDQSMDQGTPILRLLEDRPEDALTQDRYQQQLCLPLDNLARILGSKLIRSVAVTGSDPYLRTGSDLTILFEAQDADALTAALQLRRQQILLTTKPAPKTSTGKILGVSYESLINEDRSISSFLASHNNTLIVTNSHVQLEQILKTLKGKNQSIASLLEYKWFRQRYEKGNNEETMFFLLTDATIRRWCGPRWRIGASRRTQAAAILSELQARKIANQSKKNDTPSFLGLINHKGNKICSSTFGNLAFLTPIAELKINKITQSEKQAYISFRDRYQKRWRNFFDPIGGTITVKSGKLALDISILPLIEGSEYNDLREIVGDQQFISNAATPRRESLLHAIFAIDMKTRTMRQAGGFLSKTTPSLGTNALGWIGKWVSFQLEDSPFWDEVARKAMEGEDIDDFMEENFHRIPVIAKIDVRNPFKMTAFLAAFRAFLNQTSPGMLAWENQTHKDQTFVRISLSEKAKKEMKKSPFRDFALHYRVEPTRLTFALSEKLIKKTIEGKIDNNKESQSGKNNTSPEGSQPKWSGKSMGMRLSAKAIPHIQNLSQENIQTTLQWRSWNNLHILNEWRRHHGIENALKFHQRNWNTLLVCPGGGNYQWNEEFKTYESSIFGHPARPRNPDTLKTSPFSGLNEISFGLTFEEDGMRAKTEILSKPTGKQAPHSKF
ncbi:MAG: hypothetical protein HN675_14935 [Opitutae bacterium]|nr:hypothetical protein [Opitutae bacterium]MBT7854607.1 hypothetical protein [Opitutae bacterium]